MYIILHCENRIYLTDISELSTKCPDNMVNVYNSIGDDNIVVILIHFIYFQNLLGINLISLVNFIFNKVFLWK